MNKMTGLSAVVLSISMLSCGSRALKTDVVTPPARLGTLQAIAIYPFTFRYQYEPYQSYEKVQDEISAAVAFDKALVFGPDDFRIYEGKLKSIDPYSTSTLLPLVKKAGLTPGGLVVLRGWAEERVEATQKRAYTNSGKKAGASIQRKRTLICHIEALHPATRRVLFEVIGQVVHNPFAEPVEWDETPGLTRLHKEVTKHTLARLGDYFEMKRLNVDPGFDFLVNHKALFDYSVQGEPPLSVKLQSAGMLEREAAIQVRYRYFYPNIPYNRVTLLAKSPPGLLVLKVYDSSMVEAGLSEGDLVTRINGLEITGVHRLYRAIAGRRPGLPLSIEVSRKNKKLTLQVR